MDKERLQLLKESINSLKKFITKGEFEKSFKILLDFVKGTREITEKQLNEALNKIEKAVEKIKNSNDTQFLNIEKGVANTLNKALKEQADALNFIRDKVRKIKEGIDGKDGKTPTKQELIDLILPLIPEPIKSIEETAEQTRDKLETLKDDERLSKTAIKGIEEIENKIKEIEIRPSGKGGGSKGLTLYVGGSKKLLTAKTLNFVGGAGITISYAHSNGRNDITITATGTASLTPITITGTIDDSNTSFTAASEPNIVIINGASYRHGKGVTISGTSITIDNPVGVGGDIYGL